MDLQSQFLRNVLLLMLAAVCSVYSQKSKVTQADDGQSGTISFSGPNLSDEESSSPWMPTQLKCDACRIIAFQLHEAFEKFNNLRKSLKYNIPESEVLDMTETVCNTETYQNYGITEVNKVKRLKGRGLDTEDAPGIMQGGGKWPSRLEDMCNTYMGDVGEMTIYKAYRKNPKSRKQFEDYLCRGPGVRGQCKRFEDAEKKNSTKKEKEEL